MDHPAATMLMERFEGAFGTCEGLRCARAPGRVNLIGEHTDYNGGFVLPMALDREVRIYFRRAAQQQVRVWSENYGEWDEFDPRSHEHNASQPWSNYVRGVAWALDEAGLPAEPFEGVLYGDVPIGAGLSSSAAIEVASALALCPDVLERISRRELALICQRAENEFVGVNCGIMDQFVSLHAEQDHAVLIDCRSLEHGLLPLDTSRVRVVVCNTMVHHELGSSAYNERRRTCESAAEKLAGCLGQRVRQLRDVTPALLEKCRGELTELQWKRVRHVVTENERTLSAVQALAEGRYEEFGQLMNASHESLRDDYEVSCEELDLMVELARAREGVLGARMTGGGFGGCTVNLVRREHVDEFVKAVSSAYAAQTGIEPQVYEFTAARGAGLITR